MITATLTHAGDLVVTEALEDRWGDGTACIEIHRVTDVGNLIEAEGILRHAMGLELRLPSGVKEHVHGEWVERWAGNAHWYITQIVGP